MNAEQAAAWSRALTASGLGMSPEQVAAVRWEFVPRLPYPPWGNYSAVVGDGVVYVRELPHRTRLDDLLELSPRTVAHELIHQAQIIRWGVVGILLAIRGGLAARWPAL